MYSTSRFSGTCSRSACAPANASAKRFFSSSVRMRKTSDSTRVTAGLKAVDVAGIGSVTHRRAVKIERGHQRIEPRFVVPPLIQSFAKNRPAHLFGTRGPHAALGVVEFHALRLEIKA